MSILVDANKDLFIGACNEFRKGTKHVLYEGYQLTCYPSRNKLDPSIAIDLLYEAKNPLPYNGGIAQAICAKLLEENHAGKLVSQINDFLEKHKSEKPIEEHGGGGVSSG